MSPGKQKQPNCFTLVYELWPKCSAEFVTLTKRESRQKANEDPHSGWCWLVTQMVLVGPSRRIYTVQIRHISRTKIAFSVDCQLQ